MAKQEEAQKRSPVVVILGHVDHGKTSLLDAIRNTTVTETESGGITQNIYISDVVWKDKKITFIDTPGHEVFSLMRINGGKVADVALLIIAADESIQPQTMESIDIILKQKIKFVVVITKVDKEAANPEKIKNDLVSKGVYLEGYGGDVPFVEVSAKTRKGLDQLLDLIELFVDVENIVDPEVEKVKLIDYYGEQVENIVSYGVVLDSSIDKGLGKTVFGVMKYGTIKKGDELYFGDHVEKAGMLFDPAKKSVQSVSAGQAFIMTGLNEMPSSGVDMIIPKDKVAYDQFIKQKMADLHTETAELSNEELLDSIFQDDHEHVVPIVMRTDVKATLQSILPTFEKFNSEQVALKVISSGVGGVTTSDIDFAKTFKAMVLAFRVKVQSSVLEYARHAGVEIHSFDVVYHLYDYITEYVQNTLGGTGEKVTVIGAVRVKQVFTLSDGEVVAGCVVTEGEVRRGAICRVSRGGAIVGEYQIQSLRVQKEERPTVGKGMECGINLGKNIDIVEGDVVEIVAKVR